MIINPRIRGFICITAHPLGCAAHVDEQIEFVRSARPMERGSRRILIIGASSGYGLATRIVSAFGWGASTLGVFLERPSEKGRTASAGWYNSVAFEERARAADHWARSLNGDAFAEGTKQEAIRLIRAELGQVDLVVYSLAGGVRPNPVTGELVRLALKPIGVPFMQKGINTDKKMIEDVAVDPATQNEIDATCFVMGGDDWERWIDVLAKGGVLAPGATTLAYSYIGPEATWPIYKNGTIGRAKKDLYGAADRIGGKLRSEGGHAFISINKAVVTQASAAIPIVPLYNSILYRVMKEKGIHEGCIEQIYRLFRTRLQSGSDIQLDEDGRIRIDELELREDVQAEVANRWLQVTTETIDELTDYEGYRADFLRLFGFGLKGVDYEADVDPVVEFPKGGQGPAAS